MSVKVRRRDFLKLLGGVGVVAAAGGLLPPLVRYVTPPILKGEMPRSLLVWGDCRTPVKASELKPNTNYIFYYPLVDTPNILLKLESPDGKPIRIPEVKVPANMNAALEPPAWLDGSVDEGELAIIQKIATSATFYTYPGGVGKDKNIIAYSAICQHLGCPFP
ncbi:MAG: twin-arginine translocation signal domain-containing protein, partial [Desulfurococcales archaeon]|nr:twin-arginine translocation signal domain-containing protein [Desulfurococcales archaeon]